MPSPASGGHEAIPTDSMRLLAMEQFLLARANRLLIDAASRTSSEDGKNLSWQAMANIQLAAELRVRREANLTRG